MRTPDKPEQGRRRPLAPGFAAILAALLAVSAGPASGAARDWLLIEGLAIGEVQETDGESHLLGRDGGDVAGDAGFLVWQAFQMHPNWHIAAREEVEYESDEGGETEAEVEELFLRFSRRSRAPVRVEAGLVTTPIGSFSRRYLPDANPLIGSPATYASEYPYGVTVAGAATHIDYFASVLTLPPQTLRTLEPPDHAPRPAVGLGWTPTVGFRLGAYATRGTYLNRGVSDLLPTGARWRDFQQTVVGAEVRLTRGHVVMEGEFALTEHEVPTHGMDFHGKAWYLETRATFTPRVFAALRVGENVYPNATPITPSFWRARQVSVYDAEAGIGWRVAPGTLFKASYRRDMWPLIDRIAQYYPNGYAVSLQISHHFDVVSWFDRPE